MKMNYPFHLLFTSCVILLLNSCGIVYETEPQYGQVSHQTAMKEKFKTIDDVFIEFGAPDKKDSNMGIESWTYNLATRTTGSSTTRSRNRGTVRQDPNNAILNPINRSIQTSDNSLSTTTFSSTTTQDYVTFWFKDGKVVKWESLGLDISYLKPINVGDTEEIFKNESNNNSIPLKKVISNPLTVVILVGAILLFTL